MKSKIILIALLVSFTSFSQTKLGTVNSDLIIGKMPQMKTVLKRMEVYAKKLDSSFEIKAKEYSTKIAAFKDAQSTMTEDDKKTKSQEIIGLENDLGRFRENGNKMMQLRRGQYMNPLYKKLNETISEIAKANGYTQILTVNNEFAYIDERFDITQLVLDKLGIQL
ncbi:OmpH family outer membrane protein [Tenacibaculum sp.]|nr:OmpH family outer membrane protein [Tenacibaculum sp.]